jgi:hypothetical protein
MNRWSNIKGPLRVPNYGKLLVPDHGVQVDLQWKFKLTHYQQPILANPTRK